MADIKDLIGAIVNKDALSVKEIFSDIIAEKIGERMDFLRPLVAESMFDEGKMKCEECGYGMAKEDSNCKKCGCSMNEDYDWDALIDEELNESDDNVKDDAPDTVAKNHPIMQLKKLVDTKGGSFTTAGGKTLNMTHLDAARLLSLHTAAQSSETKQKLANAIHKDPIGTHDKFFPNAKINEADQAMIGGPIKVMPKHNSDHIFTYHGKGGYYGGSRTYVYANPKGDKHERFQVVHQGPDQGGEHGAPRMKVSYHPDVLSAQKHAEKLAGKGAMQVREESELDERNQANKVKKIGYEIRRGHEMVKRGENSIPTTGRDGRQLKRISRANPNEEYELDELNRVLGRYATTALNRGDIASRMSDSDSDGMAKIADKRLAGVKLAAKKMAARAGDKAAGTRVATYVDKAAKAGRGASSLSNKDREDGGRAYYAAQRGINKLRDKLNIEEKSELDEFSSTYEKPKRVVQRTLKDPAAKRMADIANRKGMSQDDVQNVLFQQGAGRKSLNKVGDMRKEETELDEVSDELARNYERNANIQRRKLSNPYGNSPEDANTLRKREAGKVSLVTRKFNKMKNANEEYELDEAGMPSGVASHKTMLRNMSDADFAASPHYGKMTDDTLRSMAWGHGYGKPGTPGHNHYVNKKKDGLKALAATEKKD